jgi:hypothetical protein
MRPTLTQARQRMRQSADKYSFLRREVVGGYGYDLVFDGRSKEVKAILVNAGPESTELRSSIIFQGSPIPVCEISCSAFANQFVDSVVILASIISLESLSFAHSRVSKIGFVGSSTISNISPATFMFRHLTQIALPESVTQIGRFAFNMCFGLSRCGLPPHLATIEASAFSFTALECVVIPNSVRSIGSAAFRGCSSLQVVTFAEESQLNFLGDVSFAETSITDFVVPTSLQRIGIAVLSDCHFLSAVCFSQSVLFRQIPIGTIRRSLIQ